MTREKRGGDHGEEAALKQLESLLDERIRSAQNGRTSKRTVGAIFKEAGRDNKTA